MFIIAVPNLGNIQDAYVIAVEENARRRLETLSEQRQVEPIDITKVGRDLNWGLRHNNNTETPAISPAYVYRKVPPNRRKSIKHSNDVTNECPLERINHINNGDVIDSYIGSDTYSSGSNQASDSVCGSISRDDVNEDQSVSKENTKENQDQDICSSGSGE